MVSRLACQWVEPGLRQNIWGRFRSSSRQEEVLTRCQHWYIHKSIPTQKWSHPVHSLFAPGLSGSASSPAFTQKAQQQEGYPCRALQRERHEHDRLILLSAHPCATQDVPTVSFSASVSLTQSSPTLQVPCSPIHTHLFLQTYSCAVLGRWGFSWAKITVINPGCLHLNSPPNPTASTNTPISSPELAPTSCSIQSLLSRFHSCQDRKQRNWEAPRGHRRSSKPGNVWSYLCCMQCMAHLAMTGKESWITHNMGGIRIKRGLVHLKASGQRKFSVLKSLFFLMSGWHFSLGWKK